MVLWGNHGAVRLEATRDLSHLLSLFLFFDGFSLYFLFIWGLYPIQGLLLALHSGSLLAGLGPYGVLRTESFEPCVRRPPSPLTLSFQPSYLFGYVHF